MNSRTIKVIRESENLKDALIDALRELTDCEAQLAGAKEEIAVLEKLSADCCGTADWIAEARALLREANCTDEGCLEEQASSRVYGHKPLYVCDWCQRRRALLGEE